MTWNKRGASWTVTSNLHVSRILSVIQRRAKIRRGPELYLSRNYMLLFQISKAKKLTLVSNKPQAALGSACTDEQSQVGQEVVIMQYC